MSQDEPSMVKILFDDGVCEEVAVSFVGDCLCRLERTPLASATEARLGDVVEFEPEDGIAKMKRIAERSPYEMLTWTVTPAVSNASSFVELVRRIERDGGRVEMAFGGTCLIHVRPESAEGVQRAFVEVLEAGRSEVEP